MLSQSGPPSSPRYDTDDDEELEDMVANIAGQALEGKDVKDLLLNVGAGGGAAAAPAAGGAAAAAGGDAEPAAEEKAEGTFSPTSSKIGSRILTSGYREGGVRRGHGLRSFRLSDFHLLLNCSFAWPRSLGAGLAGVACSYKQRSLTIIPSQFSDLAA
jgi:hypothetical protein